MSEHPPRAVGQRGRPGPQLPVQHPSPSQRSPSLHERGPASAARCPGRVGKTRSVLGAVATRAVPGTLPSTQRTTELTKRLWRE